MSIAFWIGAALMLGGALYAVLRPLLGRNAAVAAPAAPALLALRARLAELEREVAAGSLAAPDADVLRIEIEREMLQHADAAVPPAETRPSRRTAIVLGLLLPLFCVALYLLLGLPGYLAAGGGTTEQAPIDPAAMVAQLEARLESEPEDARGWDMLARSYMVLGRHADAVLALDRLKALRGDSPELMVRLADALSREAGGTLAGRPAQLVAEALAVDPQNQAGLWLAGMVAAENGDYFGAIGRWRELLALVDAQHPAREKLEELIRRAEAEARK